ncbi:MAG TPA: hypothetical protein VFX49_14820, partial [Chloroflexota bacterium]|nr:hypothetical protein [Chloroflexota bacterium]
MDALWARALDELARDPEISRASFATWLKGTRLLERDGARFTVGAQHSFAREKLERTYGGAVARALAAVSGESAPRVTFVVPGATRVAASRDERALPFVVRKPPFAPAPNGPSGHAGHNDSPSPPPLTAERSRAPATERIPDPQPTPQPDAR